MKTIINLIILIIFGFIVPAHLIAQDCTNYHELGDCIMDRQREYKIYSQSKSVAISALDTIELNIVFYGQKDYILSFCTHRKFYPVNFKLIDPDTQEILYNNAQDRYIESLGVGFDVTKSLTIQVIVLARKATPEEIEGYMGCLGLLLQYRNYPERKVTLQM
jgi:hypothetical protein